MRGQLFFLLLTLTGTTAVSQTVTDLYTFPYNATTCEWPYGSHPGASLVQASDGNFYGTDTSEGGTLGCSNGGADGAGVVFRITSSGAIDTVYAFYYDSQINTEPYGGAPYASLVEGKDGYLYGTASIGGGEIYYGTVFKVSRTGVYQVLHYFCYEPGCVDGSNPLSNLTLGTDGNFYGTTNSGGYGSGVVFAINSKGSFKTLHLFDVTDGEHPTSGLLLASDGNFYGVCSAGGQYGLGTLYRISPQGSFSVLHHFGSGPNDGTAPSANLIQASNGDIYGTTMYSYESGTLLAGSVFRFSPTSQTYTKLYDFSGSSLSVPSALVQGSDGNLYGTAQLASVFRMDLSGHLLETVALNSLTDPYPKGGLIQAGNGKLYGTTYGANPYGPNGSIFSVDFGLPAPEPLISIFGPTSGPAGTNVTILGSAFFQIATVEFDGVAAVFTPNSPAMITATVPPGAATGVITIVTKSGVTISSTQTFTTTP